MSAVKNGRSLSIGRSQNLDASGAGAPLNSVSYASSPTTISAACCVALIRFFSRSFMSRLGKMKHLQSKAAV